MKTKKSSVRNPFAVHAKKRKGGKMRSKKDARKSGKNKQREILSENE
jgi:hypothetical protein